MAVTEHMLGNSGNMTLLSKKLSERLKALGMTKYRLAKESGVAESTVINIINGKRKASEDVLRRFSAVSGLGFSYEQLYSFQALGHMSPRQIMAIKKTLAEEMS